MASCGTRDPFQFTQVTTFSKKFHQVNSSSFKHIFGIGTFYGRERERPVLSSVSEYGSSFQMTDGEDNQCVSLRDTGLFA
jgi:hypothetical protein